MDKHRTLDVLLSSLFDENVLRNWSILQEKSGSILVKLRFDSHVGMHEISTDSSATTTRESLPKKYRAISAKQEKRNQDRAKNYQDLQKLATSSNKAVYENTRSHKIKPHSDDCSTVENTRSCVDEGSPNKLLSPEAVSFTPRGAFNESLLSMTSDTTTLDEYGSCEDLYDTTTGDLVTSPVISETSSLISDVVQNRPVCNHFLCGAAFNSLELDYSIEDINYCLSCDLAADSKKTETGYTHPEDILWWCDECLATKTRTKTASCYSCNRDVPNYKPQWVKTKWPDEFRRRGVPFDPDNPRDSFDWI